MRSKHVGASALPPSTASQAIARRRFGLTGRRLVLACVLTALAHARAVCAPAAPLADTDTPIWRASHGVLLGVARAGNRVVAVGDRGHVLLSDDEGAHWHFGKAPTELLLTAVVFTSPTEGYAVGQDEVLLHSIDAGESWTQEHLAKDSDQALFSIISVGPTHLFASGAYNVTVETTDGTSWKDGKLPDLDDDYHLNCAAARGNDILVTGESGHAFIRYAGAWTAVKLPYDGSQFACLVGGDGSFYSFGLRGTAFRALPGAATWTKIDLDTVQSVFGATKLADGRFALVGANGLALLLDPATEKVVKLNAGVDNTLSGVIEGPPGKLIAVGEDGVHVLDLAGDATGAGVGQ
jgi:photosystem II stability/assembly factor-like uncharacterized protein